MHARSQDRDYFAEDEMDAIRCVASGLDLNWRKHGPPVDPE